MKNLTSKLMVAAAAMAAVAGVASAQTMKVEVPFSFRVAGTVMPAGSYSVSSISMNTTKAFRLLNIDVNRPAVVMPREARYGTAYAPAKLVFRCTDGDCALAQIWTGTGNGAYNLNLPKTESSDRAMVEIRGQLVKAD